MNNLVAQVVGLHARQESLEAQVTSLERENRVLWQEVVTSRQRQEFLQRRVQKVMLFLMNAFKQVQMVEPPSKRPRLITEGTSDSTTPPLSSADASQFVLIFVLIRSASMGDASEMSKSVDQLIDLLIDSLIDLVD
jgi:hypothetical protein